MTDVEKEMYHKVVENISYGVSKEFKSSASACYKIHKREIIKLLEEILEKDIQLITTGPGYEVKGISGFAIQNRITKLKG